MSCTNPEPALVLVAFAMVIVSISSTYLVLGDVADFFRGRGP